MPIAKRIGLSILSPLFVLLLFATAFDIGFVRTATHPATVKRLVSESGIYSSVIPNVLAQTKTITTSLGEVPTSDPNIQKAANAAIPPMYIQQNTELAIDNIYAWLDGKIAQPNFQIDLSGVKTLFANNIADAAQKRLSALPACTAAQNLTIEQSGFNVYNAVCLPRFVSPAAAAEQLKSSIISQRDFLAKTNISAANIKNGSSNQSIFKDQLTNAPKQYQNAKKTPIILTILTILTCVGVVLLSRTWQIGLRHIGISLLVVGLVMLIFSWGLNRAVSTKVVPKIKVDNAIFQQDIRSLVTDITQQIDKNYWFFGGLYTAVGAGSIISSEILRRRSRPVAINPAENPPAVKPPADPKK